MEAILFRYGAKLGYVALATVPEFRAEHVVRADLPDHDRKEVGALGESHADGYAACRLALDREPRLRGPAFADQVLTGCDQISPCIRLRELLPCLPPSLAVFAAASHVRRGEDAALLEKGDGAGVECGPDRFLVGAVGR